MVALCFAFLRKKNVEWTSYLGAVSLLGILELALKQTRRAYHIDGRRIWAECGEDTWCEEGDK